MKNHAFPLENRKSQLRATEINQFIFRMNSHLHFGLEQMVLLQWHCFNLRLQEGKLLELELWQDQLLFLLTYFKLFLPKMKEIGFEISIVLCYVVHGPLSYGTHIFDPALIFNPIKPKYYHF